jgi:hypothetical protein
MDSLEERIRILEERESLHKACIKKSKERPEYKTLVKEYNKRYYQKKKEEKKNNLKDILVIN